MFPKRPAATMTVSTKSSSPDDNAHVSPAGPRTTCSNERSRCSVMPYDRMAAASRSPISVSRKGSRPGRGSIRCTCTPSAANMHAYSQPITPPPITAIELGKRWIRRIPSASWTSSSSYGMPGGRYGDDPVATRITWAVNRLAPSAEMTSTVCGSIRRPVPSTRSIPCRSMFVWIRSSSSRRTASFRSRSRVTVISGSRSTSRPSRFRCRWPDRSRAVSRRVFEGSVPVWTAVPPGSGSRSTIATRLPK